jgi:hypothetical protein
MFRGVIDEIYDHAVWLGDWRTIAAGFNYIIDITGKFFDTGSPPDHLNKEEPA